MDDMIDIGRKSTMGTELLLSMSNEFQSQQPSAYALTRSEPCCILKRDVGLNRRHMGKPIHRNEVLLMFDHCQYFFFCATFNIIHMMLLI